MSSSPARGIATAGIADAGAVQFAAGVSARVYPNEWDVTDDSYAQSYTFRIYNDGAGTLVVDSVQTSNTKARTTTVGGFPAEIAASSSKEFTVTFTPALPGGGSYYDITQTFYTNDTSSPTVVFTVRLRPFVWDWE
jgi:hypothetical protein